MSSPIAVTMAPTISGLDHDELLRRFLAKEPGNDGVFVVGVVSTGIYCLPSCPAKLPKPGNILFFEDEDGARDSGLRACKRCRPDHFYRRYDPDRERVMGLVAEVRGQPADFADVADLVAIAGFGKTKLTELFRRYYHTSPAELLMEARLAWAEAALCRPQTRVIDAGLGAGFESSSAFHENFRRSMGLSPGAYRTFCTGREARFVLQLPDGYRHLDLFHMFGRDASGVCERTAGARGTKALVLDGRPARLHLDFRKSSLEVRLEGAPRWTRRARVEAHAKVRRMLNLASVPATFERRLARRPGLSRLVRGRRGLRIPQTSDFFEGLTWVIVGQQVNVAFASYCRSALIELCGPDAGDGMHAHPDAARVAQLERAQLLKLKFSGRKAEYLIDTARAIATGSLDAGELHGLPADRLNEELLAIRGLGPWSAQYLAMRSFGFEDCVPVGDAGLTSALKSFFGLDERPGPGRTLELMEAFAPHRSLATYHLWKTLADSKGARKEPRA